MSSRSWKASTTLLFDDADAVPLIPLLGDSMHSHFDLSLGAYVGQVDSAGQDDEEGL